MADKEYIERGALIENLKKQYGEELGWQCPVNMSDVGMLIEDAPAADVVEVVRCKDCVYFQPKFVETNNGERRPYTDEEKNSPLGMVTCDVGVNCGSRCERFDYWEDNRFPVWFQENDFCSYGKRKEQT